MRSDDVSQAEMLREVMSRSVISKYANGGAEGDMGIAWYGMVVGGPAFASSLCCWVAVCQTEEVKQR